MSGEAQQHSRPILPSQAPAAQSVLGFSHSRKWVYCQTQNGTFRTRHRVVGALLQLNLVALPWIYVDGRPAVRFDVDDRRIYAFGEVFTPTEGPLLMVFALTAVFTLFLWTSLFGRLWCGFACPQTVFLEEWARPLERLIEGDRNARIRLDAEPWSARKIGIKGMKFAAFALVSLGIAASFQAWFAGAYELWTLRAGPVDYGLVGAFTALWFFDFAYFREQLCIYLCPYARFQGALTDNDSLLVHYDAGRGEPRARGKASGEAGHCIDCEKCVAVCPQGIDIRQGYQLECISCGRCVDACGSVMEKFHQPSLVQWSTKTQVAGGRTRLWRPRTLVYVGILTVLVAAFVGLLWSHAPMEVTVNRLPGQLFTKDADGWLRSTYIVRVTNRDMDVQPDVFAFRLEGLPPAAEVVLPSVTLGPNETGTVPLVIRVPPGEAGRQYPFRVRASCDEHDVVAAAILNTGG